MKKSKLIQIITEEIQKVLYNKNVDAVFLGWQKSPRTNSRFALYNVTKPGHPLHGSTVSIKTLEREHLKFLPPPEGK